MLVGTLEWGSDGGAGGGGIELAVCASRMRFRRGVKVSFLVRSNVWLKNGSSAARVLLPSSLERDSFLCKTALAPLAGLVV